jgi:hypothetical protein
MALFAARKDIVLPQTVPSGTSAQTIRFLVKQEKRRLEAITFKLRLTMAAAAATGAAWGGLAGLVKEIRIVINDGPAGGGQRNVVQVSGIGCLSFVRQLGANIDRQTQVAYGSSGFPSGTSTTIEVSYYVPIRHLGIAEPLANVLSLPLSSKFMATDVYVEVDLFDAATVFSANAPTYAASNPALVQTHLREVDESFPYIRSEFRTDTGFSSNATANVPYEFTSGGFMTGFLLQGFSGALAASTTRSNVLAAGGQFRLEYGREVLMKTDEAFQQALNDLSIPEVYPNNASAIIASATLGNRMFVGESFFDMLSDLPNGDAFSLASVPDLNTDALGGDKFRLVFNDLLGPTIPAVHVTYHKLLSSRDAILAVVSDFARKGAVA